MEQVANVGNLIYSIRGQRVMLDADLAALYGVPTKSLNLAVKRNLDRFPSDFMFVLTARESAALRFQFETSKTGRGGRRHPPRVFTEHGVAMLSGVLKSKRAIRLSIEIVRSFIRLRHVLSSNRELARRLERVEKRLLSHEAALDEQAEKIREVFDDIRALMGPSPGPGRRIGFLTPRKL